MNKANAIAARYFAQLNLPEDLTGRTMRLTDYASDGDLKLLKGHGEWTLEFHRAVNRVVARLMRQRGATVEIIILSMPDYFEWLAKNNFTNDAANRAKFITRNP